MRMLPTESSGDFEKNAVFVSECSCRTICTYTVVCVCRRNICKCACTYMNNTIAARDPTNTHLPRRLAAPRAPTAPRASDTGLGAAGVPVRNKPPPPLVPSSASSQQSRPRAPLAAALSRLATRDPIPCLPILSRPLKASRPLLRSSGTVLSPLSAATQSQPGHAFPVVVSSRARLGVRATQS